MTVRNWTRTLHTGTSEIGSPPLMSTSYVQNGLNATKAERLARIWKDHGYNMVKNSSIQPSSSAQDYRGGPTRSCNTAWFGAVATFETPPPPSLAKVTAKLLEKWRGSDFDAGTFIGEGRESAVMMFQRIMTIADAARELRRGNFGGALASLAHVSKADRRHAFKSMNSGYFANAWLELHYGWRPLINDIYALSDMVKTKPKVGIVRASTKETSPVCHGNQLLGFDDSGVALIVNERRRHLKVTLTEPPSIYERLGLTDPYSIAWNLTTLSFLWDWFAPISTTIQAIHATRAMPVTSCCDTIVTNQLAYLSVVNGKRYGNYFCRKTATATFDYINVSRSVSPSLPSAWQIAGNTVVHSFLKPLDPDLTKLVSSVALVRSRLNGLGRQVLQ